MGFISCHTDPGTVVTISRVTLSSDLKNGTAFLLVYPDKSSPVTLNKLQQRTPELNRLLFTKLRVKMPPKMLFALDVGERHRERVEEILQKEKKRIGLDREGSSSLKLKKGNLNT